MSRQAMLAGARELGLSLNPLQADLFMSYQNLLEEEGRRVNLTAIKGPDIIPLHFLDSLTGAALLPGEAGVKMLDVGSGAGFPGIPLKIYRPDVSLHILDSSAKRLAFIQELVQHLHLSGVELLHGRAEDYGQREGFRGSYDWVTARALAPMPVLLELCLPFCTEAGYFCAYKGPDVSRELAASQRALSILKGRLILCRELKLPQSEAERSLVLFAKEGETPGRYPRKAGIPAKRPLG
jgi:16S rRNA (guanine527-N7)-methyltransferase